MVGKSQLVDALVSRGAGRTAATAAVGAVLDEITSALVAGDRVTITGFGTFEAVARPERTARNPRTGASVAVPATTVVRFHPGAGLRGAVASGDAAPHAVADLDGLDVAPAARSTAAPVATRPEFKAGKELKPFAASGTVTAGKIKNAPKDAKADKRAKADAPAKTDAKSAKDAKHGKDVRSAKDAKPAKDAKHGKDKDHKHGKAHDAKAKRKKK